MISQSNHKHAGQCLSKRHRQMLTDESGISPDVIAERGYRTIRSRAELLEFKKYQRRAPALYVPMYSPCGRTMPQIRAENPRKTKSGDVIKYETPGAADPIIDVHPRNHAALKDASRRLWITEGVKKGDSLTSAGEVAISLAGVWMFGAKELYPAWGEVALGGRDVLVVYDSDIVHKPEVAQALERLARLLMERGATVSIVYLNGGPSGEKVGVDDFLSGEPGGTTAEMVAKAVPYDPTDFEYLRTKGPGSVELKDALAYLWQVHADMPTRTDAHNTRRSVLRALIRRTRKYGYARKDKVLVSAPTRSLAIDARVGHKTAALHLAALCEEGTIGLEKKPAGKKAARYLIPLPPRERTCDTYKGERPTDNESSHAEGLPNNVIFPVGASLYVSQVRSPRDTQEKDEFCSTYDPSVSQVRGGVPGGVRAHEDAVPELRWSVPARKPSKKEIRASRARTSQAPMTRVIEPTLRLGKRRGAIVEYLLEAGGSCEIAQLRDKFAGEKARPRDFVRRQLKPLMYPAVITIEGDLVSLAEDWREALEDQRDLGHEAEADDLQRENIKRQRRAYHSDIEVEEVPEIPIVDDRSKPWPLHTEGCGCRECSERFGRVMGAHVKPCACKGCRAEGEGRALYGQVVVWREADQLPSEAPPAEPLAEPPQDPSEGHPLDCECLDCSYGPRRYAVPVGGW